ncbi:MAG: hypothetical protein H7Y27_04440, partial [Gemmatimonadaceae bacterium]|nr:hypothetical protein [Chitinophagaceae bacterium]
VSAEIQLEDGTTGDVLATFPLNKETDPGTESLNIPQDLRDVPFMFVSFTVNSTFAGKYVSFKTSINGEKSFSNDALTNAFSVEL